MAVKAEATMRCQASWSQEQRGLLSTLVWGHLQPPHWAHNCHPCTLQSALLPIRVYLPKCKSHPILPHPLPTTLSGSPFSLDKDPSPYHGLKALYFLAFTYLSIVNHPYILVTPLSSSILHVLPSLWAFAHAVHPPSRIILLTHSLS